jgi:beta-lactamase regulating signal transducer with metallopeptidase domain/uncharacterized GH25 family protein
MSTLQSWTLEFLLDVSVKAVLLVLIVWSTLVVFRVRSSSARHFAWLLVLTGMILMPLLVELLPAIAAPSWLNVSRLLSVATDARSLTSKPQIAPSLERIAANNPQQPNSPARSPKAAPALSDGKTTNVVTPAIADGQPSAPEFQTSPGSSPKAHSEPDIASGGASTTSLLASIMIYSYFAGVSIMLGRLILGTIHVTRILRRARPLDEPSIGTFVPSGIKVAESKEVRVPVTFGYRSPVVLLPADWRTWSGSTLRCVLTHEAAHIRRHDTSVVLLAAFNCTIYWFHPAAWIVRRRLLGLAEEICDDEVIRVTGDRVNYARILVEMAGRLASGGRRLQLQGVAMARRPGIERRILAVMDSDRPLSSRLSATVALLLFAAITPLIVLAAGLHPSIPAIAAEPTNAAATDESKSAEKSPVTGRVVMAEDGKAVPDATVRLLTWSENENHYTPASTKTNEKGEFSIAAKGNGKRRIAAFYGDYSSRNKLYQGKDITSIDSPIVLELHKMPSLKMTVITRADQKPVEGAIVRLTWCDAFDRDHKTDAKGEVLIRCLTPEAWTAKVLAKGCAAQDHVVNLSGTDTASVTAELDSGAELFGAVRDDEGNAIADVGISVFLSDFRGGQLGYLKTDAEGKYRFPYMPLAGLKLMLSKEGFADYRPDIKITASPGGQQELNLTLPGRAYGGSVRGVVVDSKGAPIPGAKISNYGQSSSRVRTATTDAAGNFLLEDVYAGSNGHELTVRAAKFAPHQLSFTPGTKDHAAELSIALEAGHSIRGKVVDERGEPIPDVCASYADGDSGFNYIGDRTNTDDKGRFEFDSLPAETPFGFSKEGYSRIQAKKLPLDQEKEIVVTLSSEGIIRGRVIDEKSGKPISPFTVTVTFSPDRTESDPSAWLNGKLGNGIQFANSAGKFELRDLVSGMPLQVTMSANGYQRRVIRRVVAEPNEKAKPVEFQLAALDTSSLRKVGGQLLDAKSQPIVGAEMRVVVASKRSFPRDAFPFNWEMIQSGQVAQTDSVLQFLATTTDAQGHFMFEGVRPAADIELAYWAEGVPRDRVAKLDQLSPETLNDLKIQAKPAATVRGSIDRKAFPEVGQIMLSHGMEFHRGEVSDAKDSYEIRNLPPGQYSLQIYGRLQRVEAGSDHSTQKVLKQIPVELHSGQTLTLDVTEEPPAPTQPATISKSSTPATVKEPASNAEDSDPKVEQWSVSKDEHSDIEISGVVSDESGHEISGAKLWLPLKFQEKETIQATTNERGQFTLRVPAERAEPGPYTPLMTIWCYAPNRQIGTAQVYRQLRRQSNEPVKLALKPPSDTGFEVLDDAGKPVVGAFVEPWHFLVGSYEIVPEPLRKIIGGTTDSMGRALLPAIGREGFHGVQVTAKGYGTQQLRLRDAAQEPAIRPVNLRATGRIEGRLISDDKSAYRDVHGYVYQQDFLGEHTSGCAVLEIDENGGFVVPEFAEGPIQIMISTDNDLPLRPQIPAKLEVYVGETTKVDIPFDKTIRVQGRVLTKDGAEPVAGAQVSVQYGTSRQNEMVSTDRDGRFAINVLAGDVRQSVFMRPDKFSHFTEEQTGWQNPVHVPEGAATFDLPPIELVETFERTGKLVDRNSQPIAGARITAVNNNRVYTLAETKPDGTFSLWLPKMPAMEAYQIHRGREAPPATANVIQETPLTLQIVE